MDNLTESDKQWQNYLEELKDKYKVVPQVIKEAIVNKDYRKMYGWEYTGYDGTPFIIAFENAIYSLTKTVKKNLINRYTENVMIPNEYWALRDTGMFFEFFPSFTGELTVDKEEFTKFWFERENAKGWLDLILNPSYEKASDIHYLSIDAPIIEDPQKWTYKKEATQSTKDRILSETSEETTQKTRDYADSLVNKEEPLEKAALQFLPHSEVEHDTDFIIGFEFGANWQTERMYSEEQVGQLVYNIIGEYGKHCGIIVDGAKLNELFEQFKK